MRTTVRRTRRCCGHELRGAFLQPAYGRATAAWPRWSRRRPGRRARHADVHCRPRRPCRARERVPGRAGRGRVDRYGSHPVPGDVGWLRGGRRPLGTGDGLAGGAPSAAGRNSSGLCAAEAARLADPPSPPPGWDDHPLLNEAEVYAPSEAGVTASSRILKAMRWTHVREAVGIVRRPAQAPLTSKAPAALVLAARRAPVATSRRHAAHARLPQRRPGVRRRAGPHVALELRAARGLRLSLPVRPLAPPRDARHRAQRHRGPRPLGRRGPSRARRPPSRDRRDRCRPASCGRG
jgi:hypothetical protein